MSRIGSTIKVVNITNGIYASKWGVADFYSEAEQNLRNLLASGEDFETEWCDCQKEPESVKFIREDDRIKVIVSVSIDDLWEQNDLICDAFYEVFHKEDDTLLCNDEFMDAVRDSAMDCGIDDHATSSMSIPADSTYEQVISCVSRCASRARIETDRYFGVLCDIVAELADIMNGVQEALEEENHG